ncbi:MAG: MBL fold metallo-hydrolase [Lachnospiraceae bacterium]|nr:MBL fold metallo-hydrolase [Lachnospiraceae bacterium]
MASIADIIEVNTQSSIRIEYGKELIYVDPFQLPRATSDADFVLVTHDHFDHYSPEDIIKIQKPDTRFVFPECMKGNVDEIIPSEARVYYLEPGISKGVGDLVIETVPAYNMHKLHHPKSAGFLGYIIRVGELKIYISGDTDIIPEMKGIQCDIALVPIGGTYTMTALEAAKLVNVLKPKVAIPTHFGSIVGTPGDAVTFKNNVDPSIQVEEKIKF